METIKKELKEQIIDVLNLEDMHPEDIEDSAPLFGEGLGLDSIDALELGMAVHKEFGIRLSAESAENRQHFQSVRTIADLIRSQQQRD